LSIKATDGSIGSVDDFLFSDDDWVIRWAVVDTGTGSTAGRFYCRQTGSSCPMRNPISPRWSIGASGSHPTHLEGARFEPPVPLAPEMLIELARGIPNATRMLAIGDIGPAPRLC
jgi:hypothetical protein